MSSGLILGCGLLDEDLILRVSHFSKYLDAEELNELAKRNYRQVISSAQFVYSRLLLKIILSRHLGVEPHFFSIRTSGSGRPLLFVGDCFDALASLSVSHDGERFFVAAGFQCLCGVDIQALYGVDWPLVMRTMGWSERIETWVETDSQFCSPVSLNFAARSALVWSAYEAWMKVTGCTVLSSDFAWKRISLLRTDPVTQYCTFDMLLEAHCPYNHARIHLTLIDNAVLALATSHS